MASGQHDSLSLLCFCTRHGRCDLSKKATGILNWISTRYFNKSVSLLHAFFFKKIRTYYKIRSGSAAYYSFQKKNIIITLTFLEQAIINFLTFKAH